MSIDLHKTISTFARDLSKDPRVIELVKLMDPLDVAKVLQKKFDIKPKEAAYLFAHFVKEGGLLEWAQAGGGSGPYPVPNKKETPIDEDYSDTAPTHDINTNHFPPKPQANSRK